jgi:quinohemoprotein ethanol dehydrogenase
MGQGDFRIALRLAALLTLFVAAGGRTVVAEPSALQPSVGDALRLRDASNGGDWAAYGRTYGEQHYSPLSEINAGNVRQLGLAWSLDLGRGNPATIPVAVDGSLYFASGLSVVHAVDAVSGKQLWTYDPKVSEVAGLKLRGNWGSRGVGYWDGKIYTGTVDGRLIAVDAKTGQPVWSVQTVPKEDGRYITGAPRVFDGKVIIGHGGADSWSIRGYVSTYDAESGKLLWRFYIVPGNPADGFEDKTQAMAAKTWAGDWWKYGGGGAAWNAFTYDADTDTVFVGTGNGTPWNRRVRSADRGDNLFLCSIVALDAKTGAYKWHYQVNPGESWDYNASMDMQLADLKIKGKPRKVLIQAPKNGFLYVIDRITGKLISAEKIAKVTWAEKIDVATGRPIEVPGIRYPDGQDFELWPSMIGAHSWPPSAYSPKAGLIFIPVMEKGAIYNDRGIKLTDWQRLPGNADDVAANFNFNVKDKLNNTSWLLAVDPATQKHVWKVHTATGWNGGVLATGGDLVFQGQTTNELDAYAAASGRKLWSFRTEASVVAAPITYVAGGKQYVTVLVGMGTSAATVIGQSDATVIDYRTQARRVLTFALGGREILPPAKIVKLVALEDADYHPNPVVATQGAILYGHYCVNCHGVDAIAGGFAPDLRTSGVPLSAEAFSSVVHDGGLLANGMPNFGDLDEGELNEIRQYLRSRAAVLRAGVEK